MNKLYIYSLLILVLLPAFLLAQGRPYEGPIDPAGDPAMEREGFMNGNRFRILFNNNTQISDWPRPDASKWPDDYSGTKVVDVAAVLIGAEVYVKNDSIPVTDLAEVQQLAAQGVIDTLVFIQTADYIGGLHNLDFNWNQTVEWAMSPVPGYFNIAQDFPAMSNKPESWPDAWPATGYDKKWPGEWNGRFGRGIMYADMESYFVANDAQDLEKIIVTGDPEQNYITDGPRYYPRPHVNIGDINPNTTTQKGFPWGGLGLRVEVRGYQWNNPEARDIIFWEYNIANISDYDLLTCGFGYFVDPSIGGDTGGDGETTSFDKLIDMTYVWDVLGVGGGGNIPGIFGQAYLESPGNPNDDIDNDDDGLLNERRDNPAGQLIGATDGIQDLDKFLSFYNYSIDELKPHFEGDEDQDWVDGKDLNNNGTYAFFDAETNQWMLEPGESAGDDVGLDGVAPGDLNYQGPDQGECNHQPDYVLGVGCEPNFAVTDVTEADQIGLTSQTVMGSEMFGGNYSNDKDENVWALMSSNSFTDYVQSNYLLEFFASTSFPFHQGSEERISTAMIAAYDELSGLKSEPFQAPTLFKKKRNAQVIYDRDYRFAQPPVMPTLKAYPGDGKVVLVWDDAADKNTREPLLSRANDFEGYKLYRSTDKLFQDAEIITNAQGIPEIKKPIFQCDKKDSLSGYAEFGLNEGVAFYLGNNSGISHHYVDEDVMNGRTYYYALVAYDYGIEQFDISPTENNIVVELDESENIIRMGKNVQEVTPGTPAAGYIPPEIDVDNDNSTPSLLTGTITPQIVVSDAVKAGHTYKVTFGASVQDEFTSSSRYRHHMDMRMVTDAIYVYDMSDSSLLYSDTKDNYARNNVVHHKSLWEDEESFDYYSLKIGKIHSDVFDGLRLDFDIDATLIDTVYLDYMNSGWVTGSSPMMIHTGRVTDYFAWDYDIIFTDTISTPGSRSATSAVRDQDGNSVRRNYLLTDVDFNFYVVNRNSLDEHGNPELLDLMVHDLNENGIYDWDTDRILVGHVVESTTRSRFAGAAFAIDFSQAAGIEELPQAGDVYQVRFVRPLSEKDSFVFTVTPEDVDSDEAINRAMDKIKVVPNPYVATNAMEPAVANQYLNQRRRLMFTHLPAECTIRIFTPIGLLVDEIQVENANDDGIAHWDLLSKENLEIASGMYVYQVESTQTGHKKVGKFAVIK